MNFKTIFIIAVTVLVTIVLMQNRDEVLFTVLWKEIYVSKLIMMLALTFVGFLIGLIVGRPKKKTPSTTTNTEQNIPLEVNNPEYNTNSNTEKSKLSDEDRDYIS